MRRNLERCDKEEEKYTNKRIYSVFSVLEYIQTMFASIKLFA